MNDDIALQFSWYYEIRKQHSNVIRLLVCLPAWMAFKRLSFDRTVWMPCWLMQTDKNDMKVEKSVSMHSHAFEWPCKRQIVTDPKLRNASHVLTLLVSLQQGNAKKSEKLMKILNWRRKSLYLLNKFSNFNENFRNDVTFDKIKSNKKLGLHLFSKKHILEKSQWG